MWNRRVFIVGPLVAAALALLVAVVGDASARLPVLGAAGTAGGWAPVPTRSIGSDVANTMVALDCAGRTCTGVGFLGDRDSGRVILLEHRSGSPAPPTVSRMRGVAAGTVPADVACPEPRWCMTVGSEHSGEPADRTWAAVGQAGRWARQRTPSPSSGATSQSHLTSVSCPTSSDCTAVGYYFNRRGETRGMVLTWDGVRWRRILRTALAGRQLRAIDCVPGSACLIAATNGEQAEFWWLRDGRLDPAQGTGTHPFSDISCPSQNWCAAVGSVAGVAPAMAIVRTADDGSATWREKAVRSNRPLGPFNGVSCTAMKSCVAAGSWATSGGNLHSGIWTWKGRSKRVARMIDSGAGSGQVSGVSCSPRVCAAVGQSTAGSDLARIDLFERLG